MARKRVSESSVVMSGAGVAPARRKPADPKRGIRTAAVEKPSAKLRTKEPVKAAATVAATSTASFEEAVARLAYSYWEARGCQGGSPEEDWTRAEQELRAR